MSRRRASSNGPGLLKTENLLPAAGVLLLVAAAAVAVWRWSETAATRGWRNVEGRVLESRTQFLKGRSRYGQSLTWTPVVRYSYGAAGQRLTSERVYPGEPKEWTDEAELAAFLAENWPPGAPVTVHYDPENPRIAALRIEGDYGLSLGLGLPGLILCAIGLVFPPLIRRAPLRRQ